MDIDLNIVIPDKNRSEDIKRLIPIIEKAYISCIVLDESTIHCIGLQNLKLENIKESITEIDI